MRIVEIETVRAAIQPNIMFVILRTDDGAEGLGESFFAAQTVEAYIHETAAPVLLGMTDPTPESVAMALRPYLGYASSGIETRGNGAIDLALWDLLGKRAGLSLARLLGGPVRTRLETYNTCAGADYVRTSARQSSDNWGTGRDASRWEDLDAFLHRPAELARELRDEGITGMKVWPFDRAAERTNGTEISNAELAAGLSVIGDIREAVGSDMRVMVELHGLWQLPAATRILRALEEFDPFWVEDPIRPDQIDALTELRSRTAVPIATGETATGRRGFLPLLQAGVVDYATVDLQWSGGLVEARKVASLADAYGVPIAPHDCTGPATLAACIHLCASQPNGVIQETVRAFLRTWYGELVDGLPEVEGGAVAVPETPGHGVTLRDDFLASEHALRRVSR